GPGGSVAGTVGTGRGVRQYARAGRRLGQAALRPARPEDPAAHARQKKILLLALLVIVGLVALVLGLQAAGVFTVTAKAVTDSVGYTLVIIPFVYFIYLFFMAGFTPVEKKRMGAVVLFFLFAALFWSA